MFRSTSARPPPLPFYILVDGFIFVFCRGTAYPWCRPPTSPSICAKDTKKKLCKFFFRPNKCCLPALSNASSSFPPRYTQTDRSTFFHPLSLPSCNKLMQLSSSLFLRAINLSTFPPPAALLHVTNRLTNPSSILFSLTQKKEKESTFSHPPCYNVQHKPIPRCCSRM